MHALAGLAPDAIRPLIQRWVKIWSADKPHVTPNVEDWADAVCDIVGLYREATARQHGVFIKVSLY